MQLKYDANENRSPLMEEDEAEVERELGRLMLHAACNDFTRNLYLHVTSGLAANHGLVSLVARWGRYEVLESLLHDAKMIEHRSQERIQQALQVQPTSGNLLASRECQVWTDQAAGTCQTQQPVQTCGIESASSSRAIPDSMLAGLPGLAGAAGQDGEGVAADVVVFVSAVDDSGPCSSGALGHAGRCQRDQFDRPIFACTLQPGLRSHPLPL